MDIGGLLRVNAASFEQKGPVSNLGTDLFLFSNGLSLALDAG